MKILAATLALLAAALPASAATAITVAQLEQSLSAATSEPDAKLADELSGFELTQRLSSTMLTRLESALPGPQSKQELAILAAQSSFLELPPDELPTNAAPDAAQQREIMGLVVNYVTQTTRKLPDFIATRDTRTYEDRPAGLYSYLPLHFITDTSANVVYREGQERDTDSKGRKVDIAAQGLVSWGEFGPILTTVLLDAAKSQLTWSHWEQDSSGPVAVFHYAVPEKNSHYQIRFCCISDWDPSQVVNDPTSGHPYQKQAPYHGEMAVDPSTGAIHRITVIADLGLNDPLITASIAVRYGAVDIGGKTYICPIRSEAIAQRHKTQNREGTIPSTATSQGPILTRLNEVTFTRYHIYRGESRILTDAEVAQMTGQPAAPAADNSAAETQPSAAAEAAPAAPDAPMTAGAAASAATGTTAAPTAPAAALTAPAQLASSAVSAPSAQSPPSDAASAAAQPAAESPTGSANSAGTANSASSAGAANIPVFRTTARQVLVDVVVDKKNGDPVGGLAKSDFTIEEDGKPQAIDFFEEHSAGASAAATTPTMPSMPAGAVTNVPSAPPSGALYVLLLDSLNTEPHDQMFIRAQVLSFLRKMEPGTQIAVLSLGSSLHILQGFTTDSAALLAAVSGKEAEREAMAYNRSDSADDAESTSHLSAMRSVAPQLAQYAHGQTPQGYSFGARASMTFEALNALARYLEGIPGRKNLIWFASSFPVAFFPTRSEMEQIKHDPNLPGYMNHVKQTANLFTLSKIAVYPVSGAGVMISNTGMAESSGAGSAGGTGHFGTAAEPTASLTGEAMGAASATSSMEQLAASTGGRAFTTNDIGDALHKIVHDSDVYYTVGYAPSDSAEDGSFRRIAVKVTSGKYRLAYRQGYNATEAGGAPAEDPIAGLLQLGLPNATGILYGASMKASKDHGSAPAGQSPNLKGPLTRYAVSFTIRAQDVSFGQAPNGERIAKLLIGVKAYGADGAALNWQATREAAELSPAEYASILKTGLPVTLDIDLPANARGQLVTAVYDWNNARSGTLEIALHP